MVYNIVKIHGYGRNIELKFHSRVTLLGGDSGIGKTLLYNILCTLSTGDKFKNLYCVNSNVVYRYNIDLIKTFKSQKNRLIVIDNAEEILGRKEREFILTNFENQYLIIGRNRDGLGLGYNSLGELIVNNKQIYIRYKLKEESEEITRNMKNTKLRFDFDLP